MNNNGWMPMNEVPTKGEAVLCWHPIMGCTKVYTSKHIHDAGFTHWQHLPKEPA